MTEGKTDVYDNAKFVVKKNGSKFLFSFTEYFD